MRDVACVTRGLGMQLGRHGEADGSATLVIMVHWLGESTSLERKKALFAPLRALGPVPGAAMLRVAGT